MDYQIYKYIRHISWATLIKSKSNSLPIRITPIARIYGCESQIDYDNTRYENMLIISGNILEHYNVNNTLSHREMLSVRILSPAIILDRIGVQSVNEIMNITELPYKQARKRLERMDILKERNVFLLSRLEKEILSQFRNYIETQNTI